MDRWACVSLAALPLQLVVRRNPEWRALPTVVVSEDKPQGKVLWANALALQGGVLPGQSYAVALSLCRGLRACEVAAQEIAAVTHEVQALLWRFSPAVEVGEESGVFWLDASGLLRIYPTLQSWANGLQQQLAALGLHANVVVGFSRFGSYALARGGSELRVFADPEAERAAMARVSLARLDIEPGFRDVLSKLGVHTVEALLRLPPNGLLRRFGTLAQRLYAQADGAFAPLEPETWVAPLQQRLLLDDAEQDTTRLLFGIKRLLDAVLAQLALRCQALSSLSLTLGLDRKRGKLALPALRPAVPTLDVVQLLDLVRLQLENVQLPAGAIEVVLDAEGVSASVEQLKVFAEQPRRDLAAGKRALARLRAELGDKAVVRAVLCEGHLPEASFSWQPLEDLKLPVVAAQAAVDAALPLEAAVVPLLRATALPLSASQPTAAIKTGAREPISEMLRRRPVIRRIASHPETLAAPARQLRDDGWLINGAQYGPVQHSAGPFLIVGGWWLREVHREYQFLLTRRGYLLWVYHDKRRRRWQLQGEVQ